MWHILKQNNGIFSSLAHHEATGVPLQFSLVLGFSTFFLARGTLVNLLRTNQCCPCPRTRCMQTKYTHVSQQFCLLDFLFHPNGIFSSKILRIIRLKIYRYRFSGFYSSLKWVIRIFLETKNEEKIVNWTVASKCFQIFCSMLFLFRTCKTVGSGTRSETRKRSQKIPFSARKR